MRSRAILRKRNNTKLKGGETMERSDEFLTDETVQTASLESIAIFEELESRRKRVEDGVSHLLNEDESWDLLGKVGLHV